MESREEVLTRLRFLQSVTSKATPPHCHPISILVLIISGGFVMVGMVMTIVAHWPGNVAVGFDPLRIPGPIVMAVSLVVFMLGVVMTCFLNRKEQHAKKAQLVDYAMSASRIDMSGSMRSAVRRNDVELSEVKGQMAYDQTDVTSSLLPKKVTNTDVANSDSLNRTPSHGCHYNSGNFVPEPKRRQKEKKRSMRVEENLENEINEHFLKIKIKDKIRTSLEGDGMQGVDRARDEIITTNSTTTVVKKSEKKKSNRIDDTKNVADGRDLTEEDEGSLRVKIKTKAGTSINISHV